MSDKLEMIEEDIEQKEEYLAIPLTKDCKVKDNIVWIPETLCVTMAINLLIQKDLKEHTT